MAARSESGSYSRATSAHATRGAPGRSSPASVSRSVTCARRARSRNTSVEEHAATPIEEVGVVEVDVDDLRQGTARQAHERGRRASASSGSSRAPAPTAARRRPVQARDAQRSPSAKVRRSPRARRAVDVAELRTGLRDLDVRVPAAPAEQGRAQHPASRSSAALVEDSWGRRRRSSGAHGPGAVQCVW